VLGDIQAFQQARGIVPPGDDELLAEAVAEVRTYRAERRSVAG